MEAHIMAYLNEIWFILVAVLFVGFFFLEGFDFGVGMSMQLLGKDAHERRILINTIGPFWDANEVWLITAGGAIFAAFPHWYATMFSGYYIPFTILLLALIGRGSPLNLEGRSRRLHGSKRGTGSSSLAVCFRHFYSECYSQVCYEECQLIKI